MAAAAILAVSAFAVIRSPPHDVWILAEAILFVPLGYLCTNHRVYFSESSHLMMGTIVQVAAMIVLPVPLAILTIASAKTVSELHHRFGHRRRVRVSLVNASNSVLSVTTGAVLFHSLDGPIFLWQQHSIAPLAGLPALAALATGYYTVDCLTISVAITLNTKDNLLSVWSQTTRDTYLPELSLIVVGIVFAILLHFSPLLSLLIIVPVYLSVRSFAAVARLRDETEKAVRQLAKSVDIRDTGTGIHSQQLELAATRLATAIGLTPEHVHDIGMAARAHDLGKIEISDAILLKRGPLTPEEREVMEEHPLIGANMLAAYSAFEKSVSYVKHHHERWDGKGYPEGLKGEAIPIGARVIAVVDSYDAMTSDRPYRKSLGVTEAVSRLKAGMGTQFDPRVCATWIQLLIEDGVYVPPESVPYLALVESEVGEAPAETMASA